MPEPEDYRLLIEREWADIHHSRIQEWTALGVVTGVHLGLIQIVKIAQEASITVSTSKLIIFASIIGALFSIIGVLMTCRHRHLMKTKLGWIYKAEEQLGLIKTKGNEEKGIIPEAALMKVQLDWKGLALPRLLSTSGLMLFFYLIILTIDIIILLMVFFA